jgi:hypothetical protein
MRANQRDTRGSKLITAVAPAIAFERPAHRQAQRADAQIAPRLDLDQQRHRPADLRQKLPQRRDACPCSPLSSAILAKLLRAAPVDLRRFRRSAGPGPSHGTPPPAHRPARWTSHSMPSPRAIASGEGLWASFLARRRWNQHRAARDGRSHCSPHPGLPCRRGRPEPRKAVKQSE